jgi:uncharacterized phage protein (TIGR02220 family)
MPNRILRDWTDSEMINALTPNAEVMFVRLIMKVDDYGRYPANPKLLKSVLFPIRDGVRDSDCSRWLAECEMSGLLRRYEVECKQYLEIIKFGQKPRAEKSKFPNPTVSNICEQVQADASTCITSAPVFVSVSVSESVSRQVFERQAQEVIHYLNEKAGTGFQASFSSFKPILARLKEGATVEQCKAIIDSKVADWKNDPKYRMYLRPSTLFNSEKFSNYLGIALAEPIKSKMPTSSEAIL